MEFKTANREWVKNAAIIFLAVLLVLTFFSNTIMNRSLVEVATARVTDGNIVAKVRGTGIITASGKHQVKATKTRTVRSVMVKAGQEVQTGDVLFILGEGDGDELEQAEQTLRELQTSYQKAAISMPTFNYNTQQRAIDKASREWDAACEAENVAAAKLEANTRNPNTAAAKARYEDAESQLGVLEREYQSERDKKMSEIQPLREAVQLCEDNYYKAQAEYETLVSEGASDEEIERAAQIVEDAKTALYGANQKLKPYEEKLSALDAEYESKNREAIKQRDKYLSEYTALCGTYAQEYEAAVAARLSAEDAYYAASDALVAAQEADEKTLAAAQIDLANIADQISRQQEKIKSLAGEDDNTVTANVSGKIDTIDCTAGDTVTKDSLMCTIEVPDMGHTVSFSVTNDQAQRLRTGDTATVSNYYWGNTITATLTNIRTDPKNPQTNKLLTFDLEGDVTTGSELTLSVGQKSANYDTIVPNSAIRTDNNGSFVLAISQKSSPLGNRYIAKRVSIEVLASDDNNSAVVADLGNGDYVITTGSGPIKNGDQVRMADSSEG